MFLRTIVVEGTKGNLLNAVLVRCFQVPELDRALIGYCLDETFDDQQSRIYLATLIEELDGFHLAPVVPEHLPQALKGFKSLVQDVLKGNPPTFSHDYQVLDFAFESIHPSLHTHHHPLKLPETWLMRLLNCEPLEVSAPVPLPLAPIIGWSVELDSVEHADDAFCDPTQYQTSMALLNLITQGAPHMEQPAGAPDYAQGLAPRSTQATADPAPGPELLVEPDNGATAQTGIAETQVLTVVEPDPIGDPAQTEIDLEELHLALQKITRAGDRMRQQNTMLEVRQQALSKQKQQMDEELGARLHRLEQHELRVQEQVRQIQEETAAQAQRSAELHARETGIERRETALMQKLASIESAIKETLAFTQNA